MEAQRVLGLATRLLQAFSLWIGEAVVGMRLCCTRRDDPAIHAVSWDTGVMLGAVVGQATNCEVVSHSLEGDACILAVVICGLALLPLIRLQADEGRHA